MPTPKAPFGIRVPTRLLPTLSILGISLLAACSESATIASENETFLDLSQAQVLVVTGASQEGEVGTYLPEPLTVEVRSKGGTPMAGVLVEWVFQAGQGVTAGNGSGSTSTTLTSYTDSRGRTSAAWLLGTRAGT
ncbi:MAG TPA: hypothetical protein VLA43_04540, partial [Longimicrobiales bacterium]|nr:hypothetical protein [Longimicrobiales bacterium]